MKKKLLTALLCLFFAVAAVCLFLSRSWLYSGMPRVQTQAFGYGSLHKKYSLSGAYQAQDAAEVVVEEADEFAAVVQEVCATPGQRVRAGDVLYRCAVSAELEQEVVRAKDALADTWEKQVRLGSLRSRSERVRRCEENYLALLAARDGLVAVCAPQDGVVAEVGLEAGDALRTGVCCAVVAGSEELAAQFPVTQEQAAFFANRAGIGACRVRIGNALVQAREPELVMRGGQNCLQVRAPFDGALYGASATMELELLTPEGVLLPRGEVCGEQGRQVTFYALEQREGFFGTETVARQKTAVLLDWDEEHVMVATDLPLATRIVVSASGALEDGCAVLVTEE